MVNIPPSDGSEGLSMVNDSSPVTSAMIAPKTLEPLTRMDWATDAPRTVTKSLGVCE